MTNTEFVEGKLGHSTKEYTVERANISTELFVWLFEFLQINEP